MSVPAKAPSRRSWPYRIARLLPPILLEQPWGIFIKSLCIVSGISALAGPQPGSIQSILPPIVVYLWSITLICGSISGLAGLLHPSWRRLEVAGLVWLGTAATVYAVTIAYRFGWSGTVAAGIVLGFGLAAFIRALAVYVSYEIAKRATNQ